MGKHIKCKLSDYVAKFLADQGVDCVFAIAGGASLHLIDSIANESGIRYVCPHHEQAAAMAADGYARASGKLGVALTTSGPGATNLVTGICSSFYDSVPVLFLTGQTSSFRMVGETHVRQIGFQETPIVQICTSITKYAVQITHPEQIRYELEKALHIAFSGRPGPVLIDIPDDFQRSVIDPEQLDGFFPEKDATTDRGFPSTNEVLSTLISLIEESSRPVIIGGWGIHLSKTEESFLRFVQSLNIPVALTWGGADLLPFDHPLYIGTFGTHGQRHASFVVQNADLIISLGSRLDTKATGTPLDTFARGAKKVVLDVDPNELAKFHSFGLSVDLLIQDDLRSFFTLCEQIKFPSLSPASSQKWTRKIKEWREVFNTYDKETSSIATKVPYDFFDSLSKVVSPDTNIFIDTGCTLAWAMQSLKLRKGIRTFHDFNNTAMGWALPAAIGGFFAAPTFQSIVITGDGSFMMSLHELAVIEHHKLPIKVFIINNSGYSMIRQTQDQWFDSRYHSSSLEGGLSFPDYKHIAGAFNMEYLEIKPYDKRKEKIINALATNDSILCNVFIPEEARVVPQVKFGRPNEDMEPLLPRELFRENMIVKPLPVTPT